MNANTNGKSGNPLWFATRRYAAAINTAVLFLSSPGQSGGLVTECTESGLRAAITGGGTVMFDCDGRVPLSETIMITIDTVLDGSGHEITISGNNIVRVFHAKTNQIGADGTALFHDNVNGQPQWFYRLMLR